jgi:hypothetical protein
MKNRTILIAVAGAAVLAACGQPEVGNVAEANNVAQTAPVNAVDPVDDSQVSVAGNASVAEAPSPAAPRPVPAAEPRPAPGTERQIMPLERRVDRAAPAAEPSPPPPANSTTCTPEHEAMGHCKQ